MNFDMYSLITFVLAKEKCISKTIICNHHYCMHVKFHARSSRIECFTYETSRSSMHSLAVYVTNILNFSTAVDCARS